MNHPQLSLLLALTMAGVAFPAASEPSTSSPANPPALSGGWSLVAPSDSRVKGAAEYAVKAQSVATKTALELSNIQSAQQQVVAGMNYRLTLSVLKDGKAQSAQAVVWSKLDGSYQLTDWSWK